MEKGEGIKGERGMGEGRVGYRERGEGERGMGEGRVGYPAHPSNSHQYGLILC